MKHLFCLFLLIESWAIAKVTPSKGQKNTPLYVYATQGQTLYQPAQRHFVERSEIFAQCFSEIMVQQADGGVLSAVIEFNIGKRQKLQKVFQINTQPDEKKFKNCLLTQLKTLSWPKEVNRKKILVTWSTLELPNFKSGLPFQIQLPPDKTKHTIYQ